MEDTLQQRQRVPFQRGTENPGEKKET
ncbi:unnamed protein product, partial [Allacma fusca]